MLKFIAWLALALVVFTTPACVTNPPIEPDTPLGQWQCLNSDDAVPPQELPLPPFPLTLQPADGVRGNDDSYGPAATAINAYRKQWLSIVPSLQRRKVLDDLRQAPASKRLNSIKTLIKPEFFATTEKQLMQALATTPQLSPTQKQNLETVTLQHQHMKLLLDAALARDELQISPMSARDCLAAISRLRRVRDVLLKTHPSYLAALRTDEKAAGDWAAENWAALFAAAEPALPLPAVWLLATDSARLGLQQGWDKRLIDDWRSATSRLLHLSAGPAPADSHATSQACWLIQTMALPENHAEIIAYINFLALPGRCSLFFNGQRVGQKDGGAAESCRFQLQPFAPQHAEQTIVLYFPDGCPSRYPFPIWISSSPLKKD